MSESVISEVTCAQKDLLGLFIECNLLKQENGVYVSDHANPVV